MCFVKENQFDNSSTGFTVLVDLKQSIKSMNLVESINCRAILIREMLKQFR